MKTITIMIHTISILGILALLSEGAWRLCQWKIRQLLHDPKSSNEDVRKWIGYNKVARFFRMVFMRPLLMIVLIDIFLVVSVFEGLRTIAYEFVMAMRDIPSLFIDEWKEIFVTRIADSASDEKIAISRARIARGEDI
jgi:hypothetical protein